MRFRSLLAPILVSIVVGAAALLATPGSGTSAGATGGKGVSSGAVKVVIDNFMYSPSSVTVHVGSAVTFVNEEGVEHTATADSSSFATGTLTQGQTMRIKLEKAGTFSYHCAFHAFMHGTIKVVP